LHAWFGSWRYVRRGIVSQCTPNINSTSVFNRRLASFRCSVRRCIVSTRASVAVDRAPASVGRLAWVDQLAVAFRLAQRHVDQHEQPIVQAVEAGDSVVQYFSFTPGFDTSVSCRRR